MSLKGIMSPEKTVLQDKPIRFRTWMEEAVHLNARKVNARTCGKELEEKERENDGQESKVLGKGS